MKNEEIVDQLIRQRVKELLQRTNIICYLPLDEQIEGKIMGGDGNEEVRH